MSEGNAPLNRRDFVKGVDALRHPRHRRTRLAEPAGGGARRLDNTEL